MCATKNRCLSRVNADGLCLLNAFKSCLLHDFGEIISIQKIKEKVTDYLCTNPDKYVPFHGESPDALIEDVQKFFATQIHATSEVCDMLIRILADAFQINIKLYQKHSSGKIQELLFESPYSIREIWMKFYRDPKEDSGNHYDSVVLSSDGRAEPTGFDLTLPIKDNMDSSQDSTLDLSDLIDQQQDEAVPKINKGNYFPMQLFSELEPVEVDQIPPEIDGMKWYKIKCTSADYAQKTSDRRWFVNRTSSRVNFSGIRKIGKCLGSFVCHNPQCSYLSTEGKKNEYKFDYMYKRHVCSSCGVFAEQLTCGARKLVEFSHNTGFANVYHLGEHSCLPKVNRKEHDDYICEQIKKHPNLTPKNLQVQCVKERINSGDIQGARSVSRKLSNRSRIRQIRSQILDIDQNTNMHSLEAVATFKAACDKVDEFHIYKMNDGRMNGGTDYVFKTSRLCGELGLMMDTNYKPQNVLQQEDAYFDGAHSRCQGFISLGLWVFHRSMRRLLKLVAMEVRSESQENISYFWKLWNEVLQKVGGKDANYKFNPRNIMVDSSGANYCAVKLIFGLEYMTEKLISCQWHFMHNMEQLALKLDENIRDEFLQLCKEMLKTTTIIEYKLVAGRLRQLGEKYPCIQGPLNWWHVRRWHVFGAFRGGPTHSGVNLAEIGNASWKTTGSNLSLLAAAKDDVATFILQDEEIQQHRSHNLTSRGKGPNDLELAANERRKQELEAQGLAQIVTDRESLRMQIEADKNPQYFIPGEKASHKPPSKKSRSTSVEGVEVSSQGKSQTKRRGRKKLPDVKELAQRILVADNVLSQTSTTSEREVSNVLLSEPNDTTPNTSLATPAPERQIQNSPIGYTPRRSTRQNNPPFVTLFFEKSRYKCLGCNSWINKKDYPHPRDIIFTLKAIRPFLNPRTQQWVHPERNGYFHLDLKCLQLHDNNIEMRQATVTDDVFMRLSNQQMEYLNTMGILRHITANKKKTI